MATNVQLQGEVIATTRVNTGTQSSQNVELNSQGAQLTALSLPLNSEVVRLGNSYVAGSTTAVAPVAALPTTAAQFSLWNGESTTTGTGKSYVIHSVGFTCAASAAAALVQQLLAHVTTVPVTTAPTGTAALGPKSLSGRTANTSASALSAVTITNNGVWHPVGGSVNGGAATATIAMGNTFDVNGLYVIPPGGQFSLAVFCSAAGSATNQLFITWSEVLIALG